MTSFANMIKSKINYACVRLEHITVINLTMVCLPGISLIPLITFAQRKTTRVADAFVQFVLEYFG